MKAIQRSARLSLAAGLVLLGGRGAAAAAPVGKYQVHHEATIHDIPAGAKKARLWLAVPREDRPQARVRPDIAGAGAAADIADAAAPSGWRGPSRMDRSDRSGAPAQPADRCRPAIGRANLCRDHSHHGREKVGPDIDQPSLTMHPLQEGAKSYDKRMVTCQMPRTSPCARRSTPSYLSYLISVGAWTPSTANPDARTETTPWTIASRAFVSSAS